MKIPGVRPLMERVVVGVLLVGFLAACSENSDGPAGPVGTTESEALDVATASAELDRVDAVFSDDDWASFRALSVPIDLGDFGFLIEPSTLEALLGSPTRSEARAGTIRAIRGLIDGGMRADQLISDSSLGMTFVYDPAQNKYVADPLRTGAPANGIRLILYATTSIGEPDVTQETGHADLIDNGAGVDGIDLRFEVVNEGQTFLDYAVRAQGDNGSGSIGIDGFVQGDDDRLDFDLSAEGDINGFELDVQVENASSDFRVDASIDGEIDGGEIGLEVHYGDQSVTIEIEGSDDSLEAEFYLNGELFATASGDPDDPSILGADGEPLTPEEFLVLFQIYDLAEDLFTLFGDLTAPVGLIILLGLLF